MGAHVRKLNNGLLLAQKQANLNASRSAANESSR